MAVSTISPEARKRALATLDPSLFELIILPTEQCNFRCKYCYEDFALHRMTPEIVSAIKSLIDVRAHDMRTFNLSWFGGEPLMASDVVLDISEHARAVCAARGIRYHGSMTTNGYLLTDRLQAQLVAAGVTSFQISLDGDEDLHDASRPLVSGRGTHRKIMENIHSALSSDRAFTITVRLHITSLNADSVERFYRSIKHDVLADQRFRLLVKLVGNLGGPNLDKSVLPERSRAVKIRDEIVRDYRCFRGIEPGDDLSICYAARPNSFVIRADGRVSKCTVAFNSSNNQVGRLHPDGKMGLDVEKLLKWIRGYRDLDPASLRCPVEALRLW
ncbi:radical SAM protein [Inquilinus limosus]|uniref:radical SAM protein n=1 Tax=Inquilinus limosus TaxID=171674 RepID=UPI000687FD82|nr:radical SAM protein [Inquilinus limosus]